MKCYICNKDCEAVNSPGDYEHLKCEYCGEYKISGTAVAAIGKNQLDTQTILIKLAKDREKSSETPMITTMDL
ncbi:hypothetical protein N9W78_01975 [bacterium]|nr:hypothetical protein [bacterium]